MNRPLDSRALIDLLASLTDRDPDSEDRQGVGAIMRDLNRLTGWIDTRKIQCARRINALAAEGRSEPATSVLLDESRHSAAEAKAIEERERVCSNYPGMQDALTSGAISGNHLDSLGKLTRNLSDRERCDLQARSDELVGSAAGNWVSEFERQTKQLINEIRAEHASDAAPGVDPAVAVLDRQRAESRMSRWVEDGTGMCCTMIKLDPLRDASLHAAVDAHLAGLRQDPANADRPFDQLRVEAVIAAVSAQPSGLRIPEVVVHVDARTICNGRHADTLCETVDGVEVPATTVQRLCCEAVVQAVVVNPDGSFDRLCAEQRTAGRAQRRALAAMYATCAHPHCQVAFSNCRIHHVTWFTRGGKTVIDNLLPVCERHHHLVHEGGWNLSMRADRTVTWIRPDGTVWHTGNSINRQSGRTAEFHCDRPPSRPPAATGPPGGRQPAPPVWQPATWQQTTLC